MPADSLVHTWLHLVHDFRVIDSHPAIHLVLGRLHSPVWPTHVIATGYVLDVGTSFPRSSVVLRSAPRDR